MQTDGHIRLLPIHIANQIAAGEVVERPSSVVKELLENAIDAGASRIDVSITAGGRKLIEIRDNGCGMNRDDALLCIERQATSKIREVGDIEKIATLGFRGEAIPSIASVSRFSLKTRPRTEEAGTEIIIQGGSVQEVRDAGIPVGTTVSVRDLFFNVPARRKFLRAYQTEQAHIKSVFTVHALAHPEIGFSLAADGRTLTQLPPGASLKERIRDLFGGDFLENLLPIQFIANGFQVSGFAGHPALTRNDRSEQYIFVNRRPATAPVIAYAIKEAYPPMEERRKPILLLFLDLPPEEVDVNVHPTKREVRFNHPSAVRDVLIQAISSALGITPRHTHLSDASLSPQNQRPCAPAEWPCDIPELRALAPNAAGATPPDPHHGLPFPYPGAENLPIPQPTPAPMPQPLFSLPTDGSPWSWCRVIGQIANRYILVETDSGFVTVDPKAAKERILFEKLMDHHEPGHIQKLLIPESIHLAPQDSRRVKKHLDAIRAMGFGVEEFGQDHFMIESVPDIIKESSCRTLLSDIAHDLENAGIRQGGAKWVEELIAKAVCRTVAGSIVKMDLDTAQELVDTLAKTRMPYTCPRGRPTMIYTSYRELERKFGRA